MVAVNSSDAEQKLLVQMTGKAQMTFKKLPDNAKESFDAIDTWLLEKI